MLNAFRHRRSVRINNFNPAKSKAMCSTPFGIGDRCGHLTSLPEISLKGAQRLSASEIGAVE
ncbi:uncharacterized protein Dmul_04160 [Desulfococcus multivorans]|nr:uncharacterized protein Dmul_04160 [Desulfococcus multivorans]